MKAEKLKVRRRQRRKQGIRKRVIGTSERYKTEKACDNGINSVMQNAPGAKIEDLT